MPQRPRIFTFTRNPFVRAISLAAYTLRYRGVFKYEGELPQEDFEEWCFAKPLKSQERPRDQWLCAPQTTFIELMQSRLEFMGSTEFLEEDLNTLQKRFFPDLHLSKVFRRNKSHHRPPHLYYQDRPDLVQWVARRYAKDFIELGYPKQVPTQ